ncbi:protein THEMIS [Hemiscyllium ocellatum]|uniref:protein THEMIS n=1 Tax=Hemiscyllium ocellatum TaxID=170820 RepID=UPI002966F0FD|nr:protein THEMIS [Hemiscyllium ocellatum]
MAQTLESFIDSLDPTTLPRIIQIQSGIYFQGSVYEMHGHECCLATGEVIKVIGFKIAKIKAENCDGTENNDFTNNVELPLDYPGFFKIIADPSPYTSVGDITKSVQIGHNRLGQPHFFSDVDIQVDDILITKREHIVLNSLAEVDGEQYVNCTVNRGDKNETLRLPLSYEGTFYECEDDQFYTLKEIIEWKMPKHRRRVVKLAKTLTAWDPNPYNEYLQNDLSLVPVYEIQAVMKFRKDIVYIPSNLDVEVIDVTELYDINSFVQPLTLIDVFKRPDEDFPILAEIIECPDHQHIYNSLRAERVIVIHEKHFAKKAIASENRSDLNKKHFLIPKTYKGRFKRRPREFPTVYDLKLAINNNDHLHVIATKMFESEYAEFSSVEVGDQFLVHQCQSTEVSWEGDKRIVEALACEKIVGKDYEQVLLPTYMEGSFVEVIHDKKQYNISDICEHFSLPFNVKVSVRDLSINDNLAALPSLRIEEEIADPCLLVSMLDSPSDCFKIPVQRVNLSVQMLQRPAVNVPCSTPKTIVEEISEDVYYMLRRYENSTLHPPPRPPKKPQSPISSTKILRLYPPQPRKRNPQKSPKNSPMEMPRCKPKSQKYIPDIAAKPENILHSVTITDHMKESSDYVLPEPNVMLLKAKSLPLDIANLDLSDKHDYEYIDDSKVEDLRKQLNENDHQNRKNCKKKKEPRNLPGTNILIHQFNIR